MTRVSPNGHWLRMDRTLPGDFRRQAASALMHPVTLGALGVLLVNRPRYFKALWPGAWVPGKLSRPRMDDIRAAGAGVRPFVRD